MIIHPHPTQNFLPNRDMKESVKHMRFSPFHILLIPLCLRVASSFNVCRTKLAGPPCSFPATFTSSMILSLKDGETCAVPSCSATGIAQAAEEALVSAPGLLGLTRSIRNGSLISKCVWKPQTAARNTLINTQTIQQQQWQPTSWLHTGSRS